MPGTKTPALEKVAFSVPAGTMLGLVGRSGSGKSTITRLLQGINRDYTGFVKIDGADLREINLRHLRSSFGVVLQDNFLFRGSIRDNILAGRPGLTLEDAIRAARLAGAEEFIERMPNGYETYHRGRLAQPVRRTEAAAGDRPGADHRSAHPDPGRGDQRARSGKRGAGQRQPAAHRARPDHGHRHPPAFVAGRLRSDHGAREGQGDGHRARTQPCWSGAPSIASSGLSKIATWINKVPVMPRLPQTSSTAISTAVADRGDPTLPVILEYQSPSTAIVNAPMPRVARGISWTVGSMVLACFAAMSIIKVDKVVTAQGKVIPRAAMIVIQPLETSIVRSIEVHEGEQVHAGQVLARLDPTFAAADLEALKSQVADYSAQVARMQAEVEDRPFVYSGSDPHLALESAIFAQRKSEYNYKLEGYRQKGDSLSAQIAKANPISRATRIG